MIFFQTCIDNIYQYTQCANPSFDMYEYVHRDNFRFMIIMKHVSAHYIWCQENIGSVHIL